MKRWQSGLILIAAGVGLHLLGRLLIGATRANQSVAAAGVLWLLMLFAVVITLFGVYCLVAGFVAKS
jgi:hypothetical protein